MCYFFFFFKQKTAYEMRISDWSSDVCSSDLVGHPVGALEVLGTNLARGKSWRLDKLRIASDAATLDATGDWRLDGAQRGLTVDAKGQFTDLGAFMDGIGYKGLVAGGRGNMQGKPTWRELTWPHDLANIELEARGQ